MIQVFLSINNNKESIQLPVPPEEYTVNSPYNTDTPTGLKSQMLLIGVSGLRTCEISSFFPIQSHAGYPFIQNRTMWGMQYVKKIESWRAKRIPIRLVITDSTGVKSTNMPVAITEFEYGEGKDGDVRFTLKMVEFVILSTKKR